jgi:hypothetical protein
MTPAEAIDRLYDLRPGTTPLAEGSPHELEGKSLHLPKDPAFHPPEEGLAWRRERLSA